MSFRRQRSIQLGGRYRQVSLYMFFYIHMFRFVTERHGRIVQLNGLSYITIFEIKNEIKTKPAQDRLLVKHDLRGHPHLKVKLYN